MEAIKLIEYKCFRGRNIHSHTPIFQLVVDIGNFFEIPTNDIADFNKNLLANFPNLCKHTCSLGYEGGFITRLNSGTYLGHILEHIIIDMQNSLGFKVKYGKTVSPDNKSIYNIFFEYENEDCALECCYASIDILNSFIEGNPLDLAPIFNKLESIKEQTQPGPSTAAIILEAKKRKIPVLKIGSGSLIRLGYGNKTRFIQATLSDSTSSISVDMCSDKHLTKQILSSLSIPTPQGYIVNHETSAVRTARMIGLPVVIKPLDANQGKGVQINLKSDREIKEAYRYASKYNDNVIVEKYITGNDYRVLVVGDKVSAVSHRIPPTIKGDGQHSIKDLVEELNRDCRRGSGHGKALTKVMFDDACLAFLERQKLSPDYIPKKNEIIKLRENGNLSTGGISIDCTDDIHPDNANIAVMCSKALGVDIAGIDIISKDISKSILENDGAIIEVNAAPGIRMHLYPSEGKPRNVAKDILQLLYPEDNDSDFPIISVTGTNGKTTTVRLAAHILGLKYKNVGLTCTTGTYINGKCIKKGDNSGYYSAQEIISNRIIEAAVLETARGGIIRKGLGYDLANVGIITNISEDHLELDDIHTVEDMVNVKSLVVEAIKPGGYAVLNAEDELTNDILKNVTCQIIFFYNDINNVKVNLNKARKHVFVEDGVIKIYDDGRILEVENISTIPLTLLGLSECNIKNCLAATAAAYAINISLNTIAEGLRTFKLNSGRFEIHDMDDYKVMLDYGHNFAAYEEVIKFCNKIDHKRLVGIIGVPGDRTDSSIKKIGNLAAVNFSKIYIKEDTDLRNRCKDEIANMLYKSIVESKSSNDVLNFDDEITALSDAIKNVRSGDLIVVFYEKLDPLVELINKNKKFANKII